MLVLLLWTTLQILIRTHLCDVSSRLENTTQRLVSRNCFLQKCRWVDLSLGAQLDCNAIVCGDVQLRFYQSRLKKGSLVMLDVSAYLSTDGVYSFGVWCYCAFECSAQCAVIFSYDFPVFYSHRRTHNFKPQTPTNCRSRFYFALPFIRRSLARIWGWHSPNLNVMRRRLGRLKIQSKETHARTHAHAHAQAQAHAHAHAHARTRTRTRMRTHTQARMHKHTHSPLRAAPVLARTQQHSPS